MGRVVLRDNGGIIAAIAPMPDETIPDLDDVKRQLERVLASKRFKAAPRQAKLLDYVVRSALDGTDIKELIIGPELFSPYDPESTLVRTTAVHLRRRLAEYYAAEGTNDPVILELPPGGAYKPLFTYNPRSEGERKYQRGLYHLTQLASYPGVRFALASFDDAIRHQPAHALAHAARAEALIIDSVCNHEAPPAAAIHAAEASAREALRLNPQIWSAHLALGVAQMSRWRWSDAAKAFAEAIAINPRRAGEHPFHIAFLLATNQKQRALPLITGFIKSNPADPLRLAVSALLLYAAGETGTAHVLLLQTIVNNPMSCWLTHVLFACFDLGLGDDYRSAAASAFHTAQTLVDRSPYQPLLFPGLYILCLAAGDAKQQADAKDELAYWLTRPAERYITHLQLALACMGVGETGQAIRHLELACDENDPWMAWLAVLPIFDPLRTVEAFQKLVQRINASHGMAG